MRGCSQQSVHARARSLPRCRDAADTSSEQLGSKSAPSDTMLRREAAQQPCPRPFLDVDRVAGKAAAAELGDGRRLEWQVCQGHGGRCPSGLRAMAPAAGRLRATESDSERVPKWPNECTKDGHRVGLTNFRLRANLSAASSDRGSGGLGELGGSPAAVVMPRSGSRGLRRSQAQA